MDLIQTGLFEGNNDFEQHMIDKWFLELPSRYDGIYSVRQVEGSHMAATWVFARADNGVVLALITSYKEWEDFCVGIEKWHSMTLEEQWQYNEEH